MSLSRSPSPALGGGWSSPGLRTPSGQSSPASGILTPGGSQTWDPARMGPPPTATTANGHATNRGRSFLGRHMRRLSTSLPQFQLGPHSYSEKEKLGRERWAPERFRVVGAVKSILGRMSRKLRLRLLFVLFMALLVTLWYTTRMSPPTLGRPARSQRRTLLTARSATLLLAAIGQPRRRQQVRHRARRQRRGRRDELEGRARVGR